MAAKCTCGLSLASGCHCGGDVVFCSLHSRVFPFSVVSVFWGAIEVFSGIGNGRDCFFCRS